MKDRGNDIPGVFAGKNNILEERIMGSSVETPLSYTLAMTLGELLKLGMVLGSVLHTAAIRNPYAAPSRF